ncbi:MAG: hypothetical protein IT191_09025 [Microbacteriaceae bacterium]|nr:hypothetical protein [Microbacteriaceae bacterium]
MPFLAWYVAILVKAKFDLELQFNELKPSTCPPNSNWHVATSISTAALPEMPTRDGDPNSLQVPFFESDPFPKPADHISVPIAFAPISENPFRLANLSSDEPVEVLTREGRKIATRLKVGQRPRLALDDVFGDGALERIEQAIGSAKRDARTLLEGRLWWPLSKGQFERLQDMKQMFTVDCTTMEQSQADFLNSWICFELTHEARFLENGLKSLSHLTNSAEFDLNLAQRIQIEESLGEERELSIVKSAKRRVIESALARASESCLAEFLRANDMLACQMLRAILDSPLDDEQEEQALSPILEWTSELFVKADSEVDDFLEDGLLEISLPETTLRFIRIATLIGDRHPTSKLWLDRIEGWYDTWAVLLRQESVRLVNDLEDFEGGKRLIQKALKIAPENRHEALRADLAQIQKLEADSRGAQSQPRSTTQRATTPPPKQAEGRTWRGILPISCAPTLITWNGFGTKIYGAEEFYEDRNLQFSILYLTALYIPVIPLTRYLVQPMGDGRWSFLGKTTWTSNMKWHFLIATTIASALFVYVAQQNPSMSNGPQQEANYSQPFQNSSAPARSYNPPASDIDFTALAKEMRLDRLAAEYDDLKQTLSESEVKLSRERDNIDLRRAYINQQRADLDAQHPDPYNAEEIDLYNERVDNFNANRIAYGKMLRAFNRKVDGHNKLVHRQKELVAALNEGGR